MTPEKRRLLADLLIHWEDLYKQGQDTTAEFLCKDHPELAATLRRRMAALKRVSWLDKKLEDDGDNPADDLANAIKQHLFCKSRFSEAGHLASMFR